MSVITANLSQKLENKQDTILIIDDNPTNLGLIVDSLEKSMYRVIVARNGEMGIKRAKIIYPDIILLDVMMPGINGFETCRRLKSDDCLKNIPIIFMTALDNVEDKIRGFEMGGVDYITKPVEVREMLARLKAHLAIYKLQNVNQQNKQLRQEIAKRQQVEKELCKSKELAEAANHAKSVFLANMSHEFRTPLNGILGYAQIFQYDKTLSEAQREGMQIIQHCGEHLLTLIDDILDISKIEVEKMELIATKFRLTTFLTDIVYLFKMRAEQKGIKFVYKPQSQLPDIIYADSKRLRQILLNLLSNAIKFTQEGQVTFMVSYQPTLTLPQEEKEQGMIHFDVKDSGVGIAAEYLTDIFLPFQQINTQDQQQEGTGLGLSISKKLIELMDGQLQVQSTPNEGSHFWFEIPLKIEGTLQDTHTLMPILDKSSTLQSTHIFKPTIIGFKCLPTSLLNKEEIEVSLKSEKDFRILVVDNKWDNSVVLISLLISLGFQVQEAINGQDVLVKANEFHPDAIIMDLKMPVMDGLECTRQLRQNAQFQKTVIIALSANTFDYQQQESLEAGCNAFLTKPLKVDVLLQVLAEQCSLEWIYETPNSENPISIENTNPTPEQLETLFNLAKIGDINAILEQTKALENEPHLQLFAKKIRQFAKNFEVKKIKKLLTQYLK